jgi:hypothetical protein
VYQFKQGNITVKMKFFVCFEIIDHLGKKIVCLQLFYYHQLNLRFTGNCQTVSLICASMKLLNEGRFNEDNLKIFNCNFFLPEF